MRRWRAEHDAVLGDVLERIFADPEALGDGRVFVDRIRVQDARLALGAGALVEVGAARAAASADLDVLHEEAELIAVHKPAGLPSVPDHHGHDSVQARVAKRRGLPLERVHPTSRLDRDVSGVVTFALGTLARAALAAAREEGTYERLYVAVASGTLSAERGAWDGPIGRHPKDPRQRRVRGREAVDAHTDYRVVARAAAGAWLELEPQTGRTHQLRVHCAHAGAPLYGDAAYGGPTRVSSATGDILSLGRIALHAFRVTIPWQRGRLVLEAPLPAAFLELWAALEGDPLPKV